MPPKHEYVELPSERPPIAWSKITDDHMDDVSPSNDGVAPQSSGAKARSNRQMSYKKIRFDSVLPQTSGVSAHKKVSLDSIPPQTSGESQDQATNQITQSSNRQVDQHPNKMPAFPLELISVINEIRGQPIPVPMEPEFFFDTTQEAAARTSWCSNGTVLIWAEQSKRRSSHPLATALSSRNQRSSRKSSGIIRSGQEWNACSLRGHGSHSRR